MARATLTCTVLPAQSWPPTPQVPRWSLTTWRPNPIPMMPATPTTKIDVTALGRPVSASEVRELAQPYRSKDNDAVWRWHGQHSTWHEVHSLAGDILEWTVWVHDQPLDTLRMAPAPRQAESPGERIVRLRRSGADGLRANRVLDSHGYAATQHVGRDDCNCLTCHN